MVNRSSIRVILCLLGDNAEYNGATGKIAKTFYSFLLSLGDIPMAWKGLSLKLDSVYTTGFCG